MDRGAPLPEELPESPGRRAFLRSAGQLAFASAVVEAFALGGCGYRRAVDCGTCTHVCTSCTDCKECTSCTSCTSGGCQSCTSGGCQGCTSGPCTGSCTGGCTQQCIYECTGGGVGCHGCIGSCVGCTSSGTYYRF